MNSSILTLTLLFAPMVSAAGGTMVGNGGGFAEMQALFLDQRLSDYLAPFEEMQEFRSRLDTTSDLKPLSFDSECYYPTLPSGKTLSVVLPSCLLYGDEASSSFGPEPLAPSEIGAWVFAVRWMNVFGEGHWSELVQKGRLLFSEVKREDRRMALVWKSQVIAQLHQWSIRSLRSKADSTQLTLEFQENSVNLLSRLEALLDCPGALDIDLTYLLVQSRSASQFRAHGPVQWTCDDNRYQGQLIFTASEGSQGIPGDILSLSIVGRTGLEP